MNRMHKQDKQRFVDHELAGTGSVGQTKKFFRHSDTFTVGKLSIYILNGKIMERLFYS